MGLAHRRMHGAAEGEGALEQGAVGGQTAPMREDEATLDAALPLAWCEEKKKSKRRGQADSGKEVTKMRVPSR